MLSGPGQGWPDRRVAVRAVVMVLRGRLRQYWKSWPALSVLVALAGGFVLASAAAGRRTAAALPGFTARRGGRESRPRPKTISGAVAPPGCGAEQPVRTGCAHG